MKSSHLLRHFLLAAGSSMLAVSHSHAAQETAYWDGTSTNGDANGGAGTWNSVNTNWDSLATSGSDIVWDANASGDDTAVFGGTAGTITVSGTIALKALNFTTAGYTINGSTLAFSSGGTITVANPSGTNGGTITSNITGAPSLNLTAMDGNDTFTLNPTAGGSISIGTVSGSGGGGSEVLNLQGGAGSTGTIGGVSGGVKLNVSAGAWTLNGAALGYAHTISGGTLTLNATLTAGNRDVVLSGGVLNYNVASAVAATVATASSGDLGFRITGGSIDQTSGAAINTNASTQSMTWANSWTFIGTNGAASNLHLGSGAVFLKSTPTTVSVTNAATTLTVGGVIQNDSTTGRGLTKAGAGTLLLSGTSTYSGATTVSAGTFLLGGSGGLNGTSGVSVNGGTYGIRQTANANNSQTGTLALAAGTALTMADGFIGNFNVAGATTLSSGSSAATTLTFNTAAADATSDRLVIAVAGTNSNSTNNTLINIVPIANPTASTNKYTVITAGSGMTPANFTIGSGNVNISNTIYSFQIDGTSSTTQIVLSLVAGSLTPATAYWTGGTDSSWKTINGTTSVTNFTNDAGGLGNTYALPGSTTNVFVSANSASNLPTMTLDGDTSILGLTYTGAGTSNTAGSTFAVGSGGALTIGTGGVTVQTGSGANIISAPVTLGGAQSWTNNSSNLLTVSGGIDNGANLLTIAGSGNTTISGVIGSGGTVTGGLTKSGAGTLTLTNANAYTGTTTLSAGTLALSGGTNRLLNTGTVAFTGASTLDIGSTSQTLSAITVPDTTYFTSTINGSGGTLTINGASDLQWGPGGAIVNGTSTVVNLNGLSNFVYNSAANTFRVGYKPGSTNAGTTTPDTASSTVTLAASNTITAATLALGDQTANNHGGASTLRLGAANILNVANISIGFSSRSNATLDFNAASSAVTIRNTDGSSAVSTWNIGSINNPSNANHTFTDAVNLSNGTIDALVTSMTIGSANASGTNRAGTVNASFTMAGGSLTVGTMNLGQWVGSGTLGTGTTMAANGTFTLNSASGIANITTLTLATNTGTTTGGTSRTVSGTFNLTNGTLNATTVQRGTQGGTATATLAFNWGTGTISNISGGNLTWNDVPITLSAGTHNFDISGSNTATLNSASVISGTTFGITKIGTGTLNLSAVNTYTGATAVDAGTLAINGTGTINNTSAINVAVSGTLRYNSSTALIVAPTLAGNGTSNRAVLGGTGLINASITLDNLGDVLSPGNSPGIQSYTPAQTWASFSYDWEVNNFTGTTAGTDFDQLALSSTLSLTGGSGSYMLNVLGLTAGNTSGLVPNFSETDRSWTILTSGGISGFNAANWTIDTIGFTDPDTGTWAITQSGNDLVLSYTVIPEPSTALLCSLGLLALLRRRRN